MKIASERIEEIRKHYTEFIEPGCVPATVRDLFAAVDEREGEIKRLDGMTIRALCENKNLHTEVARLRAAEQNWRTFETEQRKRILCLDRVAEAARKCDKCQRWSNPDTDEYYRPCATIIELRQTLRNLDKGVVARLNVDVAGRDIRIAVVVREHITRLNTIVKAALDATDHAGISMVGVKMKQEYCVLTKALCELGEEWTMDKAKIEDLLADCEGCKMHYGDGMCCGTVDGLVEALQEQQAEIERLSTWSPGDQPIPEDRAVEQAHPVMGGDDKTYLEAHRMVEAKKSKYALVALVNWLLDRITRLERVVEAARRWRAVSGRITLREGEERNDFDSALHDLDKGESG